MAILPFPGGDSTATTAQLPANIEAEAAFLGALLIDNRIGEDLPIALRPEHFFEPLHARMFQQIMTLLDRGSVVTAVTLKPYFDNDEAMKGLGGQAYLAQLTASGAGLIGAHDFARQIYDLALLRELVGVGRTLVERATDTSEDVDPMRQIEEAESALYRVAGGEAELGAVKNFGAASLEVIRRAERALNSGGHFSGVTTGLSGLNRMSGGLQQSDLVILAGRPGMGKTALATNIAFNAARRFQRDEADGVAPEKNMGARVAFFSLEMSADQLATRIMVEQSGVDARSLRQGSLSREDFHNLSRASQDLYDLPIFIDDTPGLSIAGLRARARRMQRRHGIGLIIVDYLQLLGGSAKAGDNRVQEISEISRGLKTLAKELNVPVLALSQLSRQVESREDKRPQLSDLRESGSIEQDADIVLFVFREEYYVLASRPKTPREGDVAAEEAFRKWHDEKLTPVENRAEVIIGKNRHGATGTVDLVFEARITRFSDLAEESYESYVSD